MKSSLGFVAILTLFLASNAVAQGHRRLAGNVVDQAGSPIAGARIHLTSPELRTFETTATTDKKGAFTVLVVFRDVAQLEVTIDADGFSTSKTTFALVWGGNNTTHRTFNLVNAEVVRKAEEERHEVETANLASSIHNLGAELASAGDWAGAAAKFEEALKQREDQSVTHAGLATAAWNLKDFPRAETHARRALALDPAAPDMTELLAEALSQQGKEAEAETLRAAVAETNPKMKAERAFNRGADHYNNSQHKEAITAFEEAIAADPELVDAHYALAMAALALNDNAMALAHLNSYLAKVPDGTKSDTARSIIAALPKK